jgi:hypothetical protein
MAHFRRRVAARWRRLELAELVVEADSASQDSEIDGVGHVVEHEVVPGCFPEAEVCPVAAQ